MIEHTRGHGEKFTRKMDLAIGALLVHPTIGEAAKAAGVASPTLWRWLQREDFKKRYRQVRQEAVSQAVAQLQQVASDAVRTLQDVMKDPDATASAKVSAARTVLEMSLEAVELEDLAERVEQLERQLLRDPNRRTAG